MRAALVPLLLLALHAANAAAPAVRPANAGAATAGATASADAANRFDLTRPEIASFIDQQVAAGADRSTLTALLSQAEPRQSIIDAMNRPAEKALQWHEYRARFLTEDRIASGVRLWREQQPLLERVAREQRVSPEYILAIIGVETFYGRITGKYRVLDALSTLAFNYPPRAEYFRQELAQFLQLAREQGFDALQVTGSYAGAMGVAQFMPSSYRRYARGIDGSPKKDLWQDWGAIFASVGNYLHSFGWEYGGMVSTTATLDSRPPPNLPTSVSLSQTLGDLRRNGWKLGTVAGDDTQALVVEANEAEHPGYRAGFRNFYVITRYNRSPLYAMAVSDLGAALRERMYGDGAVR